MNTYIVTIESSEYNPIKHIFEDRQFEGEFQAKSERGVKTKAKNFYAMELDTEPKEINVISVKFL
jgi:hypothetical protein